MSSVNSVSAYGTTATTSNTTKTSDSKANASTSSSTAKSFNETAAVYEKSDSSAKNTASKTNSTTDRSAIIKQLKADSDARQQQLINIVRQSLSKQAGTYNKSQGLASIFDNLTVTEDVKLQAQKDIAEDGYWGVEQTSDRILDFAKALAGNDSSKAEELLAAFKKGFEKATAAWGTDLPGICQDTYAAVEQKFQKWMDGTEE